MSHDTILRRTESLTSDNIDLSGSWQNEIGSTVEFRISGNKVEGTYTSAVSSRGGTITGDVLGHINGDLIAFTVNWPTAAITAWVGQHVVENETDIIRTLWQMTTNIPDDDEPTGLWNSVYAGANDFIRLAP